MKSFVFSFRFVSLLLILLGTFGLASCASTDDSDNASVRPWNAPKGWETGMPTGLMDRQR